MPSLKRGKVLIEDRWNIVLCGGLAAYLLALGLGVGDARPHARPYEGQFQLIEDGRHLKEGCAHGVHVAIPAIHCNGAKVTSSRSFFWMSFGMPQNDVILSFCSELEKSGL